MTCCSPPGREAFRRGRRMANSRIRNPTTTNCITMKSAQGCSSAGRPTSERKKFPKGAKCSLKKLVIPSSLSGIDDLEDELHENCRDQHKKPHQDSGLI